MFFLSVLMLYRFGAMWIYGIKLIELLCKTITWMWWCLPLYTNLVRVEVNFLPHSYGIYGREGTYNFGRKRMKQACKSFNEQRICSMIGDQLDLSWVLMVWLLVEASRIQRTKTQFYGRSQHLAVKNVTLMLLSPHTFGCESMMMRDNLFL